MMWARGTPRPEASLMLATIPVNARLAPIIQSDCVRAALCIAVYDRTSRPAVNPRRSPSAQIYEGGRTRHAADLPPAPTRGPESRHAEHLRRRVHLAPHACAPPGRRPR